AYAEFFAYTAAGCKAKELRYPNVVGSLLRWLLFLHPARNGPDFLLDVLESSFALVPREVLEYKPPPEPTWEDDEDWRDYYASPVGDYAEKLEELVDAVEGMWKPEHSARWWRLLHWRDMPVEGVPRHRPDLKRLLAARRAGAATEADLYDQFL